MSKPKYLSRFTYNSAVSVEINEHGDKVDGTVRAVKFTEASVFYDVVIMGALHKDTPASLVHPRVDTQEPQITDVVFA